MAHILTFIFSAVFGIIAGATVSHLVVEFGMASTPERIIAGSFLGAFAGLIGGSAAGDFAGESKNTTRSLAGMIIGAAMGAWGATQSPVVREILDMVKFRIIP